MTDRVLSNLSLAAKAGKVKSGETSAAQAIRSGQAFLVVVASDASENTKKKFRNMAKWYDVPCVEYADRGSIGHVIGKEYRSAVVITDEGLSDLICRSLKNREGESRRK